MTTYGNDNRDGLVSANKDKPIRVMLDGVEHRLTVMEAVQLRTHLTRELDALRVKCPTCRCMLMPGMECGCCRASAASDGLTCPPEEP